VLKEEIDMGWVFPKKANFGNGNAFHDRGRKCQKLLAEVMCHNPSLRLTTKARACEGVGQE